MFAQSSRPRGAPRAVPMLIFALLAGLIAAVLPGPGATDARAAVLGHHVNINGWALGTFLSSQEGAYVYCLEPGATYPGGDQRNPDWVERLPGYTASTAGNVTGWSGGAVTSGPASGATLRHINYVIETHGQTTVPERAAAVQLAVWMLRDDPGLREWLAHHVAWIEHGGHASIVAKATELAAEARARAHGPSIEDPAPLKLSQGSEFGEGTLKYPAGTKELTIEGGVFEDGATSMRITDERAGEVRWSADLHPNGWQRMHEVSVTGRWQLEASGWAAALRLHPPVDSSQQMLGTSVGTVTETRAGDFDRVSVTIDAQFSPQLGTQVPERFVERGSGRFADTVTFDVAGDSAPWAQRNGTGDEVIYAPVTAEGTLYGPFTHPQSPDEGPPASAPVAATAEVTATRGPGEYRVVADDRPDESGYYSWVWSIRETSQAAEIRDAELLPADYLFSDRFGLVEEGQVVPTSLRWTTQLRDRELTLDKMVLHDTVTPVLAHGAWLRGDDGARIPATLRLTAYQTDTEPSRQATPPDEATELTTSLVTASTPEQEITADPMPIPFETRGWVTVQTCLLEEDQVSEAVGYFEEWCDDFGIPAETAKIVPPEVRTEAVPQALVGDMITDTAIVSGVVPAESEIHFEFYLQPEAGDPKFDEHWRHRVDTSGDPLQWSASELDALTDDERCLVQPVARTTAVNVEEAGSVQSPEVRAVSAGTGYWVETLVTRHPETGEEVELHRGECGLENERTVVLDEEEVAVAGLATTGVSSVAILAGGLLVAGVGLVVVCALGRHRNRAAV